MFNLNNKGQSLVLFIVVIPIFVLLLTLVFDVGSAIYNKNALSNTNYIVVDYGLDNIDTITENDLIELVKENDKGVNNITISIDDNAITIILNKKYYGVIGKMFDFDLVEIVSEYKGEIIDNKKRIERIK